MSKNKLSRRPTANPAANQKQKLRPTGIDGVSVSGEPEIAKAGVRMIAIVYDGMLILALLFLVGTVLTVIGTMLTMETGVTSDQAQTLPRWYQNLVLTPAFILTLIGFYGLFWRRAGQTLGMQTWRLKTVDSNGQLLTWMLSIKRILAACVVPVMCGLIGYLLHGSRWAMLLSAFFGLIFNYAFCLFNSRGLAVHDMLSSTVTLKMPKIHHQSLLRSLRKKKGKASK
ncbi:RDD family protein [Psychrobacter sp. FDAARGOS_221]|uniref:RDD family protein n=1 Tax=Psychrobacter sp. FDAARGOS_221 TaxID=1975705 RepID=UPI000BB57AD7|nr:RDD family protein [Psychrobacter sp. FDAARGOS_221]PNK60413.1 RDD family protein [Psychrobacter sp. FDAARGOS_221]